MESLVGSFRDIDSGTTGACTTAGNAGRGTASRNTETNRGRLEEGATTRAAELVQIEKEKQKFKPKSTQDTNATKPDEDDTTSRGSAGGRSQGARKRKSIAEANAEKAKVEKERDELREALGVLEAHLGTGTRPYDSEDGFALSRRRERDLRNHKLWT